MRESILARIVRYGLYASTVIPLVIFSQYISPFHFGKVIVFRTLLELVIPFWLVVMWRDKSYRPSMTLLGWAVLAFGAAFTLVTFTSVSVFSSFWGSLERMGGLWTFLHFIVFFLMLISMMRTKEQWVLFLDITVLFGIVSALYGFLQRGSQISWIVGSGSRERIFGTIGNAALFAGYQILIVFYALMQWFRTTVTWRKWLYGTAVALCTLAVFMTAVRGSLVGIVAGFLLFAFLSATLGGSRRARLTMIGGISLVLVFVALGFALKNTPLVKNSPYLSRVTAFSPQTYTVQTRIWAWSAGFKGWKENAKTVLVGWGPENFNIPFSKYFNPKFFQGPGSETLFDRAHNMFVEVLVTMGLVGWLAYMSIFVTALILMWRLMKRGDDARMVGIGFASLLVAYAIHNSFIFDTSANFYIFFSLMAYLSWSYTKEPARKPAEKDKKGIASEARYVLKPLTAIQYVSIVILSVCAVVLAWNTNVAAAKANRTTTRAIVAGWQGDAKSALQYYQKALQYQGAGKYEIRHRFAQWVLEITDSGKIGDDDTKQIVQVAIEAVAQNAAENPHDYLPLLYESRLYIVLGREGTKSEYNDKALELTSKALEISPTFVRTFYEIAQAYLNKGDLENAAKNFQRAVELNPEVGLSWWYWGVVVTQAGDEAQGEQLLNKAIELGYRPPESAAGKLITIYANRGEYQKMVPLLEQLTQLKPDNAQYWAMLAEAYRRVNRVDDAIAAARKIGALDSKLKQQADQFIKSLGGTP